MLADHGNGLLTSITDSDFFARQVVNDRDRHRHIWVLPHGRVIWGDGGVRNYKTPSLF